MAASDSNQYLQWVLPEATGLDALRLQKATAGSVGDNEVAVELHAASLNYRELVIVKKNAFPPPWSSSVRQNLIPGSDGSGVVVAVGKDVRDFQPGDGIVTHMTPQIPDNQPPAFGDICGGIGHALDGTLRQYGHFEQSALVHVPQSLKHVEAATLTCSGLTAWNALFGLRGREVKKGDWVLVQGSGGVSIAALQFAAAAGANVVATTSSEAKAERVRNLGVKDVLNYRSTPTWSQATRELTPESRGFDFVIDIGGDATLGQSLEAVRTDGIVVAAGMIGGPTESSVPMMAALTHVCTVRGLLLGTRDQFKDMVKFIDEHQIKPAIDERIFAIDEAVEAMRFLERQAHFSKIVIKLR